MSKNIEMQEKTSSSTYETLYPKTSASQVFLSEEAKQATNGLENLDQAASFWGGSQFEIGDVKISARNNLGSKWLECNGDIISKTDYPQLSNYCEEKGWPFGTEIMTPTVTNITYDADNNYYRYGFTPIIKRLSNGIYLKVDEKITVVSSRQATITVFYSTKINSPSYASKLITVNSNFNLSDYNIEVITVGEVNGYIYIYLARGQYIYGTSLDSNDWKINNNVVKVSDGSFEDLFYRATPTGVIAYKNGIYAMAVVNRLRNGNYNYCSLGVAYNTSLEGDWQANAPEPTGELINEEPVIVDAGICEDGTLYVNYKGYNNSDRRCIYRFSTVIPPYKTTSCIHEGFVNKYVSSGRINNIIIDNNIYLSVYITNDDSYYYSFTSQALPANVQGVSYTQESNFPISKVGSHYLISYENGVLKESSGPITPITATTYTSNLRLSSDFKDWFLDDEGLHVVTTTTNGINIENIPYGIMLPIITITSTNSNVKAYIKGKD